VQKKGGGGGEVVCEEDKMAWWGGNVSLPGKDSPGMKEVAIRSQEGLSSHWHWHWSERRRVLRTYLEVGGVLIQTFAVAEGITHTHKTLRLIEIQVA